MRLRTVFTAVALTGMLGACSAPNDDASAANTPAANASADDGTLKVVATTTQICDYVTRIAEDGGGAQLVKTDAQGTTTTTGEGDDTLELTCLLAPNASAHDHEMTSRQMNALGEADILFVNGVDLEHFLDQAVESSGFAGTMAVTSGFLGAGDAPSGTAFTVDEGEHTADVAPWPFEPEPGEEEEFAYDPHVWTSPRGATVQVRNIANSLDTAAGGDGTWVERAEAYLEQLKDLDVWVSQSISTVPREDRVLFTSHDAFGYFARDYDVDFIGSALSDFNAQQDATAEHIRQGVEQVRDSNAKVIFAENSNNAKSIEAIARAAGVRVITGEDALYGDSLGPAGTAGESYIGSIVHNVSTLVTAWGGEPAPLPDTLEGA
ncbi:zinc/manganese transport system substrate-binding protein [Corynebacterium timonense]|uniref:Zinc/manganese transport system substrate-binding protein n=2 Tax=Corynebacterium timonense TaxID=441500 RepID=A0A1H1LKA1_9CORY|nr:metal ABC transporter substrate-binding protein [Corynebacterium timonense]SDR74445.1 zinc/manganese transport system substrate-binding protein [Corynebacterium timonense]